jgi:hypothetical protein
MRLNFAGVAEQDIREGIARIARTLQPDTGLLGTLMGGSSTGAAAAEVPAEEQRAREPGEEQGDSLADIVELPRRERGSKRRSQDR